MDKELVLPLVLPKGIEDKMESILEDQSDLPPDFERERLIQPVVNPAYLYNHSGPPNGIPALKDTDFHTGNLRLMVVNSIDMWAGQSRALDEISNVLREFYVFFVELPGDGCCDSMAP